MLTNEQIKDILNKPVLADVEQLAMIRRFIWDKKGKDVGEIKRPMDFFLLQKMIQVYGDVIVPYYTLDVFKNNLE